ncbi:MAG: hypothetical protein JW789_03775 [Candidatus Aenigmarchaeota archaeon]|nr:hypothetical protein [Candidatus Aenigmarchaeota archaeon]
MALDFTALETLLPFLLILAVSYGALETVGMFRNKAVKAIIAVVLAFFAISNSMTVTYINGLLPYAAILFIIFFGIGFVKKSLSGGQKDNELIIIIIVLVMLFVGSLYTTTSDFNMYQYNELVWIAGIAVIGAILYGAYRMKEPVR